MKNNYYILLVALVLSFFNLNAQTNNAATNSLAIVESKADPVYELTLGGGGVGVGSDHSFGLDVSLSAHAIPSLPSLWLGVAQGVAWEPKFAGSTDLFSDWSWHLYKQLYVNTGWSGGAVYGVQGKTVWRTGPELSLEYYVGDSSFVYAGVNYDFPSSGEKGFRYSFGIGMTF